MKPILALILTKQGSLQNGLLALLTTIPQISAVLVAEDADSGLRMLNDHRPKLVLLDMNLAQDSTETILKHTNSQLPTIGSIVLVDSVEQGRKAVSLGADDVLLKGFSADKLISLIEEILERIDSDGSADQNS